MAFLARLYDFAPDTLIESAKVDSEFNQIVQLLAGSKIDTQTSLKYNSSATTLSVDNTGGGNPLEVKVSGVVKARVTSGGQIQSTLTTGTAPFIVASTTMTSNLNADLIDGAHLTQLVRSDLDNQMLSVPANQLTLRLRVDDTYASYFIFEHDYGGGNEKRARFAHTSGGYLVAQIYNGATWDNISRWNPVTKKLDDGTTAYATLDNTTAWSFAAFYPGSLSTQTEQPVLIGPDGVSSFTVKKIKWSYRAGTPGSNSTIKLQHLSSTGTTINEYVTTLSSGASKNTVYSNDIADFTVSADEQLRWIVTAANGHQDVSIQAQGTQKLF